VRDDEGWSWHDQRAVMWAAGLAAVALIALLVVAVMRTSESSDAPPVVAPAPSVDTMSGSTYTTSSTSTSYPVPSVLTSEDTGAPVTTGGPTTDEPSTDESTTPTSTSNPYGTTTPTNAGHV
jgi:hypothetical protein